MLVARLQPLLQHPTTTGKSNLPHLSNLNLYVYRDHWLTRLPPLPMVFRPFEAIVAILLVDTHSVYQK